MSGWRSASARESAGTALASPALPRATQTLRSRPARPARRRAEPRISRRSWAAPSPSTRTRSRSAGEDGRSSGSGSVRAGAAALNGQTSWHTSQPNTRVPMAMRSSRGMGPRFSMVRYEMQRRASSDIGPLKAPVGHASRQARHSPHRLGGGPAALGSSSTSSRSSPSMKYEPSPGAISMLFLPTKPRPARAASSRSSTGAVSTHGRAAT